MTEPKQPPPGVETTPGGPVVSLSEAAKRLNKDPRTIIRAIKTGSIRGGAMPRPERLRWYVYADELAPVPSLAVPSAGDEADTLRAQVVSLTEANRLLIAAQQDLLDADRSTNEAADKYRAVARNYLDALAQFMTPGNLGELASRL
ncbi:hypothetical protein [Mycobacterium sp. 1465703.0]|uniref:hypothetical protein n=1 Tax=Mycobacterium sp. 1465703.0 TaxID=1834078 RepID=UPI0007FC2565|nr:hypothetical protein [Mycobacterium sp. 1465703.0]OBJ10883.1 hypothetical protein A5625_10465 [Mycobacterium sp. 1465703.0]